jgi:hypothetical protein
MRRSISCKRYKFPVLRGCRAGRIRRCGSNLLRAVAVACAYAMTGSTLRFSFCKDPFVCGIPLVIPTFVVAGCYAIERKQSRCGRGLPIQLQPRGRS